MTESLWDSPGIREYQTGVDRGMVYPHSMQNGVPWVGLVSVSESSEEVVTEPIYIDGYAVAHEISPGRSKLTVEAYNYPEEFGQHCLGETTISGFGVTAKNQVRGRFNFSYRRFVGNETGPNAHYKIVLVSNAIAIDSEASFSTVSDSTELSTFSWDFDTAVRVEDFSDLNTSIAPLLPTSIIVIDTRRVAPEIVDEIEALLYHPVNPRFVSLDDIRMIVSELSTDPVQSRTTNPRGRTISGTTVVVEDYDATAKRGPIVQVFYQQAQLQPIWSEEQPEGWRKAQAGSEFFFWRILGDAKIQLKVDSNHDHYYWSVSVMGQWVDGDAHSPMPTYQFTSYAEQAYVEFEHEEPHKEGGAHIDLPPSVYYTPRILAEENHGWAVPSTGDCYIWGEDYGGWNRQTGPAWVNAKAAYNNYQIVSPDPDLYMDGPNLVGPRPSGWTGNGIYYSETHDAVFAPKNINIGTPGANFTGQKTVLAYEPDTGNTERAYLTSLVGPVGGVDRDRYIRVAVTPGVYDGEYFDGDVESRDEVYFRYVYEWNGTPHASGSTRNKTFL